MAVVLHPQPAVLQPDGSHAVWIAVYAIMIAAFVIGWAFAIFGIIGLHRDGYDRWATGALLLSIFCTPLAGIVVYLIARSNHDTRVRTLAG